MHNKTGKRICLPIVIGDSVLRQYFPHQSISHEVWIGPDRLVKAITGAEYVTAGNIEKLLNHEDVDWPVKRDFQTFDYNRPLLSFNSKQTAESPVLHYSALLPYIDGVKTTRSVCVDSSVRTVCYNFFNMSLLQLCSGIAGGQTGGNIEQRRLILQVADRNRYIPSTYFARWRKDNTYCYSIMLPMDISPDSIENIIREDLSYRLKVLFGITARQEKRPQKILRLIRRGEGGVPFLTKGAAASTTFDEPDNPVRQLINQPFSDLCWSLNTFFPYFPEVYDETGIPSQIPVDITLHTGEKPGLPQLRHALQQYGLDLVEEQRLLDMCVITESTYSNNLLP
ncbi:hypothetical protein [Foetidibacter luteolus]|uniref:hypothetical protein n=1 Tax=Foetidibacter luteolus TaxID=2608880 RepID=UPI001F3185CD|nr:hypothetical protein [Foetidibacter luteolus]